MAVFSRGAAGYATANFGPKSPFGSGNQVGLGWISDGVYSTGSSVELTDVWSITAAYQHMWNPKWKTSVYGGFVGVKYDDTAKATICAAPATPLGWGGVLSAVSNCDPNFSYSQLGTRTQWNPVPDLELGVDLTWYHINTAFAGTATVVAGGARPTGTYNISDQDVFTGMFHIQRNFLY
jgi:hypothetical protein